MKRSERKQIKKILMENQVPEMQENWVAALKQNVYAQARQEAWESLAEVPLWNRLLRQVPYVAGWVWVVQLSVLMLLAEAVRRIPDTADLIVVLLVVGPVLALLPVVELVKSYGCNMWEMEAACRYDLRQITAMRLCIVGAADGIVLAAGGIFYGMRGGGIWEYGLFVLVPFLASSSVYLWELEHFSKRCSGYLLAATGVALSVVFESGMWELYAVIWAGTSGWIPWLSAGAVVLFGAGTVCCAIRLCRDLRDRKGEYERWSLE